MNNLKSSYGFVLKNIKNTKLINKSKDIKNKTFVIAGGTRGIDLYSKIIIRKRCKCCYFRKNRKTSSKIRK